MKEYKKHNKLVRDNVPDILKNKGIDYEFHIADDNEYESELYLKLQEELEEFILKPSIEKLADILEVIDAIRMFHNISLEELKKIKINKKKERGGFKNKIILDTTEE
jgi:predicted house-cleaning noncanonical NTP pyrophosphatase (MazG superfamily)